METNSMRIIQEFLEERYYWDAELWATWVDEDDDEKVVCRTCRKPILGAAFIYRGRDMFFHISCLNVPTNHKALLLHFSLFTSHDPFIFTEEVKNDGKEDVNLVCFGCEKPVSGAGYKCSTSDCNLLLHKSCLELPPQIQQHPFHHPNHTLSLVKPEDEYCNACGKSCNAYPFYHCSECDFNLDIACATRSQINNIDGCQHSFISFFNQIQFICQACGEEGKDLASLCSICQLLIHGNCARFSRIIKITSHDHSLTLTYSLHQVKEHNSIFCNLCYQKVKTKYGAYYCKDCNYVVHLACAFKYEEDASLKLLSEEFVDLATTVKEVEGVKEMQHFSHQHDLILSNKELTKDELCNGCMELISTPFYSCTQCNFFLHGRCAQLPRKKRHLLHRHQLKLLSWHRYYKLGLFSCHACQHLNSGFTYTCMSCDFDLNLQCCSITETLTHKGHQHSLFLAINSNRICHVCNRTSKEKPGIFVCTNCDFALGLECATLPLLARHKYDDHLLMLTCSVEAHCEEFYCLICEEVRDPKQWFYSCAKCDFTAHSQCVLGKYPYIKFGSTFTSKGDHQHPLTFVPKTKSSPPCDACGETFDGLALECTQCKFNVHRSDWCLRKITHLKVMIGES